MVSGLHIHYLKYFFDMGYFKVFIEFVTILLLFYVLVFWLRGMWGLSSTTKNQPCTLMSWKAKSFNHWITREIPSLSTVSGISMSKTCLVQPANLQSIAWRGDGIGGMGAPPHNSTVDLVSCFEPHPACIGEGNGNPLQCSCLENPRDGGAWWAAVYGIAQSQTQLKRLSSNSRYPFLLHLVDFPLKYHHFLTLDPSGSCGTSPQNIQIGMWLKHDQWEHCIRPGCPSYMVRATELWGSWSSKLGAARRCLL